MAWSPLTPQKTRAISIETNTEEIPDETTKIVYGIGHDNYMIDPRHKVNGLNQLAGDPTRYSQLKGNLTMEHGSDHICCLG